MPDNSSMRMADASPSPLDTYAMKKVPRGSQISWLTFAVVCMFGIGSWIAINGIWMELPVLISHAPEGWNLPSYLTVVCQLANVGPLLYSLGKRYYPKVFHERPVIYLTVMIGIAACIFLSIFWKETSYVFGSERSTALIVLSFCVALVDCTSTVTFLPFMAILPELYMSPLFIGENMSGLIPSIIALVQGSEVNATLNLTDGTSSFTKMTGLRFSQSVFFSLLALLMVICLIAFTAINFLPSIKLEHVRSYSSLKDDRLTEGSSEESLLHHDLSQILHSCAYREGNVCCSANLDDDAGNQFMSFRRIVLILIIQGWINCLSNGVISSIQSYACEPYGSVTYHFAATLGSIAAAMACFGFLWVPLKSTKAVTLGAGLYTVFATYIIFVAACSPDPPLKDHVLGKIIIIVVFILANIFVAYTKLAICTVMRELSHKHLFWCGVAIQLGSFIGAIIMFPIVNFGHVFKSS